MKTNLLERDFLHIHIIDGKLYVFFDDGHWQYSKAADSDKEWLREKRVTLKDLGDECCLGPVNGMDEFLFRIPLKDMRWHERFTKFGMLYLEKELL